MPANLWQTVTILCNSKPLDCRKMALGEPECNLPVHLSTILPIIVDTSHKHAVQGGEASSAQAVRAKVAEQRGTGRSVAAPGFARADVGSCHEIGPCVDIGRPAARTNPAIATPARVRRTVPPGQAHLARHACGLPHRTAQAWRVWRTCSWPGRSTPRRPAKTAQTPPVVHKASIGNISIGQRFSHGARQLACEGRIGPPRPNRLVSAG